MQRQTLETALNAARQRQQPTRPEAREALNFLVAALRSRATHMDQIVQRRVGLYQENVALLR